MGSPQDHHDGRVTLGISLSDAIDASLKPLMQAYLRTMEHDLREAAANLFAMLHELDRPGIAAIAVMAVPETGLGAAINDRLRRAAAGR